MHKFSRWLEDRERFFWALHSAGWAGFALIYYLGSFLHEMRPTFLFVVLLNALSGWILSIPLRYIYRASWQRSAVTQLVIATFVSYLIALLWTVMTNFHFWEIYKHGFRPDNWIYYFSNSLASFYVLLCWTGLYFGIKYYQMLQKEKQRVLNSNTMAHQAHLKMLRYQLNPHFLFNTLNAISTLILIKENDTANRMVTRLSEFLRYSLENDPIKQVPLYQEVQVLTLYLEIEKVRFEDRLSVVWNIEESAKSAYVPNMLLQPLIENAIKHAIAKLKDGGEIKVSARQFGRDLLIEIADNGPGANLENGQLRRAKGVGLPNIEQRLQTLYGDAYSLDVSNNKPQGLKISIRIPYKDNNDEL